jgi:hypothetical protein
MIAKKPSLVLKLSNSATLTFKGENGMKKLATFVFAMLLTGSLALAQGTGDSKGTTPPAKSTTPAAKKGATKTSKAHKGGKKGKKGTSTNPTPAPK